MYEISNTLFSEIKFISKIVSKIVGTPVECEGLLLSSYGGNRCRYTSIPPQEIEKKECKAYSLNNEFKKAYAKEQQVMGIWHSHADFEAFHSMPDDEHLIKTILPLINKFKFKNRYKLTKTPKGIKIESPSKKYLLNTNSPKDLRKLINSFEEELSDKVLSLVIGKNGHYAKEFNKNKSQETDIILFHDNRPIRREFLINEIGEKIRYKGIKLNQLPNFKEYTFSNRLFKKRIKNFKNNLSTLTEIINGEYKINEKKVWFWQDRFIYFNKIYSQIKRETLDIIKLNQVINELNNSSYQTKEKKQIKEKIIKLKYLTIFKKIRKKRINAKKQ